MILRINCRNPEKYRLRLQGSTQELQILSLLEQDKISLRLWHTTSLISTFLLKKKTEVCPEYTKRISRRHTFRKFLFHIQKGKLQYSKITNQLRLEAIPRSLIKFTHRIFLLWFPTLLERLIKTQVCGGKWWLKNTGKSGWEVVPQ